ncbi:uncharacterized protein BJ171DRAFT_517108 [Polychytrium aggregatum]|uniref:uncharacterized protein n=1 Tax=Polychytrium aggregatum TaxID=110093 RepID=UPI0022FDD83F|nr:uncharacterized protein BJ171DRAFT_517108 [Polychytrium aggregatum]KAI9199800.1 hypothetical protein BJ171DRAFT_517108 [Polychytrium aggregatum]
MSRRKIPSDYVPPVYIDTDLNHSSSDLHESLMTPTTSVSYPNSTVDNMSSASSDDNSDSDDSSMRPRIVNGGFKSLTADRVRQARARVAQMKQSFQAWTPPAPKPGDEAPAPPSADTIRKRTEQMAVLSTITTSSGWDFKLRELVMREAREGNPEDDARMATVGRSSNNPRPQPAVPSPVPQPRGRPVSAMPSSRGSSPRSFQRSPSPSISSLSSFKSDLAAPTVPAVAARHRTINYGTIIRGYDERLQEIVMEVSKNEHPIAPLNMSRTKSASATSLRRKSTATSLPPTPSEEPASASPTPDRSRPTVRRRVSAVIPGTMVPMPPSQPQPAEPELPSGPTPSQRRRAASFHSSMGIMALAGDGSVPPVPAVPEKHRRKPVVSYITARSTSSSPVPNDLEARVELGVAMPAGKR